MKNLKFIIPILFLTLFITSCNNDDENPDPVNEEEVITTLIVNMVSDTETVTFTSRDLDGDGPNPPVIEIVGDLKTNKTYAGTVQFLNETEDPAEDITLEVVEEADEHQVFFIPGGGLNVTFEYENFDGNNNPLGTLFTMQTTDASSGTLNFTLRHEPNKPNNGTLADAGGETDISVNFNDVSVED